MAKLKTPIWTTKGRFLPLRGRNGLGGLATDEGVLLPTTPDNRVRSTLLFGIDGLGSTITTGVKGEVTVRFPCVITSWTLLADLAGSIVVDVWKTDYDTYPPVVTDSICAGTPPTLTGAIKNTNNTLDGWFSTVSAGDTFRFNVASVATVTRVTLALAVHKPADVT